MEPFIGTEALAAGDVTRGELRWNSTAVLPNIYLPNGARRVVFTNAAAAWLWSGRKGIIAGRAAASLHGVNWIENDADIDMIAAYRRPCPGVVIRRDRISESEVCTVANLPVTTPARTALDLARQLERDTAVAHLDALSAVTGVTAAEVLDLAECYPHTRGIRAARDSVDLMDCGVWSRRETWLRLLVIDAGMPTPQTDIDVEDDQWDGRVAVGWERWKVGLDIQDELITDPYLAVQDVHKAELLQRLGWLHLRVLPKHPRSTIIHRVRMALRQRRAI
ncbi:MULTISPECIES: hypothetical protein [unclassified Mycolicibacterium]|uniref:hypothetical protein n=1 Tax=unclassified Mycolicibacterium TaxID=2636767 RepID=UPI0012DDAF10|nr:MULTISPECIES: hypothetical protein [unclassified Mycolicibacterium]MUL85297.1 hypothetical protein [Mycolicibacterium sp. CBMA 329]MUL91264.1 hypothetical protein [Mycolicibacterium sp. CBMA 331]MUM02536.1 hypothetical protein [Mycolicibacterium sp. CBMA 334]MUM29292.1 hypothetical protein [Mycolicibacterium sp. CBMA 295]MUM41023.1 hypothetical protein [Mycolicibacterium sp. CBMA 247]